MTASASYRLVLAAPEGDGGDAIRAWVQAPHPGAAIDRALARVAKVRRVELWPIEAAIAGPGETARGESIGDGVTIETAVAWPTGAPRDFRTPRGVALAAAPGGDPAATLHEGFTVEKHEATWAIEAVVAGPRLRELFLDVIEQLPAADNVEVRLLGHFDAAGKTDVYLSPRFPKTERLVQFLDDFDADLLDNGHVELAIYLRAHASTLRLTDHKTIVFLTDSDDLRERATTWFTDADIPAVATLGTIAAGHPHYHLRPADSLDRAKLAKRLERARLRHVDTWPDAV